MHARTIGACVRPDSLDEAVATFRDSIMPDARRRKGCQGGMLLVDRARGRITSFTLWETQADMKADEAGGYYQARGASLAPLLAPLLIAERDQRLED